MFAEEETACAEVRAGAYPFLYIWPIFVRGIVMDIFAALF
jgi:hypothetical protein